MRKLLHSTLAAAIGLTLTACGGSSSSDSVEPPPPPTPTTLDISGKGIKGTLGNALVEVFSADDANFANVLATTQTDANGDYTVTITDETGEPIVGSFVVRLSADEDSTMVCDATFCGDHARGEIVPAAELANLTLSTLSFSDGSGAATGNVNTLTSMATDTILSAIATNDALDLTDSATFGALQQNASQVVGAVLGVNLAETNIYEVTIVDAAVSTDVSTDDAIAATLTLLNASFSGLDVGAEQSLGDVIGNYVDAVEAVASAVFADENVDLGAVAAEAVALINNTQAQLATGVTDLATDIGMDTGTDVPVEDIPDEIDPTVIGDIIGDIVIGTGGTGGTGG